MNKLLIFGDESGTMPVKDSDDIFVTSSISVFNSYPSFDNKNFHREWVINFIKEKHMFPAISYVLPRKGYSKNLKDKYDKINIMARMTRLMTGANKQYLTKDCIPLRNHIWLFCTLQSINNTIINSLIKNKIFEINVFLDQKSLAYASKNLFIRMLQRKLKLYKKSLLKFKDQHPEFIKILIDRFIDASNSIYLFWSNEENTKNAKGGLLLAHYLASYYKKDFNKHKTIQNLLKQYGFKNADNDVTDLLLIPPNQQALDTWQRNTGLKPPK